MQKGQKLPPKQRHSLELKGLPDALMGGKVAEGLLNRAPDLFLLGAGFFLGFVMNMRPGLTVPLVGFIGFPDFGGAIDSLRGDLEGVEKKVESREAILAGRRKNANQALADCQQHCFELRRAGVEGEDCVEKCVEAFERATQGFEAEAAKFGAELATARAALLRHRIAQGLLMATMIYAFTRSGFLQGIGEIIPG